MSDTARKVWTVQQANEAVIYLMAIARDMKREFAYVSTLRRERSDASPALREFVDPRIEMCERALSHLQREVTKLGVDPIDIGHGVFGFNAKHPSSGAEIVLIWKLGDRGVRAWMHRFDDLIRPIEELPHGSASHNIV